MINKKGLAKKPSKEILIKDLVYNFVEIKKDVPYFLHIMSLIN